MSQTNQLSILSSERSVIKLYQMKNSLCFRWMIRFFINSWYPSSVNNYKEQSFASFAQYIFHIRILSRIKSVKANKALEKDGTTTVYFVHESSRRKS